MIVGLTGGIGSGKTTVAKLFEQRYQIPLYISDIEAKRLMIEDTFLVQEIKALLGDESYLPTGELNRGHIGGKIFKLIDSLGNRKPHFIHLHLYLLP